MTKQVKFIATLFAIGIMAACTPTRVVQKSDVKTEWLKTKLVEKDFTRANSVEANFYMGITEVSQKEFEALMGFNPSEFPGESLPVENVTWYDAAMFCNKLSEKEGVEAYYTFTDVEKTGDAITAANLDENKQSKGYRLPTKDEWRYAAAGGAKSAGYKYSGSNTPGEVAWYKDNSEGKTHTIATKKANELGLFDMSGNVWEWTNTESRFDGSRVKAFMGGAWAESESNIEVKSDNYDKPENRNKYTGFRVARFAEIIAPVASAPEGIEFKKFRNYKDVIKEIDLPVAGNGFSLLVFNNYNYCTGNCTPETHGR